MVCFSNKFTAECQVFNKFFSLDEKFLPYRIRSEKFSTGVEWVSKRGDVARDFYPFVEDGAGSLDGAAGDGALEVREAARIAVYDDAAAAPRVVMVEATEVRAYLEEITATVARLVREQGGGVPFMVIREIVENFVHAYFRAPTISILDGGNTIRFSDRGPGIREKDRALEFGTTSATEEMKHYIRGVGSGLPYVQQYMEDKGGSLDIEDNLDGGTVVTISTRPRDEARAVSGGQPAQAQGAFGSAPAPAPTQTQFGFGSPSGPVTYPMGTLPATNPQVAGYPTWQPAPQVPGWGTQTQQGWAATAEGLGFQTAMPAPQQPVPQPQPTPQQPPAATPLPEVTLDERSRQTLSLLAQRGEAGPTDLVRAFGSSAATWSRTLSAMAAQGLATKVGQKYRLTGIGRALA